MSQQQLTILTTICTHPRWLHGLHLRRLRLNNERASREKDINEVAVSTEILNMTQTDARTSFGICRGRFLNTHSDSDKTPFTVCLHSPQLSHR